MTADNIIPPNILAALLNPNLTSQPPPPTANDLLSGRSSAPQMPNLPTPGPNVAPPFVQMPPPPMPSLAPSSTTPPPALSMPPPMTNPFKAPPFNPFLQPAVTRPPAPRHVTRTFNNTKSNPFANNRAMAPINAPPHKPGYTNPRHEQVRMTDCQYYMTSGCTRGEVCYYRHSTTAKDNPEVCSKWFQTGKCTKDCPARHPPIDNKKIGAGGKYSHMNKFRSVNYKNISCKFEKTTGCRNPQCPYNHNKYRTIDGMIWPPTDVSKSDGQQPPSIKQEYLAKTTAPTLTRTLVKETVPEPPSFGSGIHINIKEGEEDLLKRVQAQFSEFEADKQRIDGVLEQAEQRRILDVSPPKPPTMTLQKAQQKVQAQRQASLTQPPAAAPFIHLKHHTAPVVAPPLLMPHAQQLPPLAQPHIAQFQPPAVPQLQLNHAGAILPPPGNLPKPQISYIRPDALMPTTVGVTMPTTTYVNPAMTQPVQPKEEARTAGSPVPYYNMLSTQISEQSLQDTAVSAALAKVEKKKKKKEKKEKKEAKKRRLLELQKERSASPDATESKARKLDKREVVRQSDSDNDDSRNGRRTTTSSFEEEMLHHRATRKSSDEKSETTLLEELTKNMESKKALEKEQKRKKKEQKRIEKLEKLQRKHQKFERERMKEQKVKRERAVYDSVAMDVETTRVREEVLKVSKQKSPIRARLDFGERHRDTAFDRLQERYADDASGNDDFTITIKQDVVKQRPTSRTIMEPAGDEGFAGDARSHIRQNKEIRKITGDRLTSTSSDDYVHPSEKAKRDELIREREKRYSDDKSGGPAARKRRITVNRLDAVQKASGGRQTPPHTILKGIGGERPISPEFEGSPESSKQSSGKRTLLKRKLPKRPSDQEDGELTDEELHSPTRPTTSQRAMRANKPLPGASVTKQIKTTKTEPVKKSAAPVLTTAQTPEVKPKPAKPSGNALLLKPKPNLSSTVISTKTQNFARKPDARMEEISNVLKKSEEAQKAVAQKTSHTAIRSRVARAGVAEQKTSSEVDISNLRKCSVNSEAIDQVIDDQFEIPHLKKQKTNDTLDEEDLLLDDSRENSTDGVNLRKSSSNLSTHSANGIDLHDEDEALMKELDAYLGQDAD